MNPRPVVIAHRGASGYLPEHTAEAKALAHAMGADYLEQDVVATRDAQLLVMHDIFLDAVTDVAAVFPGRARSDGRHYAVDFELAEIRTLNVVERRRAGTGERLFPERFRAAAPRFGLATLAEELELIQDLNRTTGREAGIYPEVKEPQWHHEHGIDLAKLVLGELDAYGYRTSDGRAYVQCFDAAELERMRRELKTELPLVQLLPASDRPPAAARLPAGAAEYAAGAGIPFEWLVSLERGRVGASPLLASMRRAGLAVHAYTLRRERVPAWAGSFENLLACFFAELRVDGVFCDHPDIAVRVRNSLDSQQHSSDGQPPETGLE